MQPNLLIFFNNHYFLSMVNNPLHHEACKKENVHCFDRYLKTLYKWISFQSEFIKIYRIFIDVLRLVAFLKTTSTPLGRGWLFSRHDSGLTQQVNIAPRVFFWIYYNSGHLSKLNSGKSRLHIIYSEYFFINCHVFFFFFLQKVSKLFRKSCLAFICRKDVPWIVLEWNLSTKSCERL